MSFLYLLTLIIIFLAVTGLYAFTPYYTRRTECFGVSIPENEYFSPLLRTYRKRFAVINVIIGLLLFSAAVVWYVLDAQTSVIGTFGIFIQTIIGFFVFLHYRRRVTELKNRSKWKNEVISAVSIDLSNERKDYVSAAWLLLFPIIIAVTVALGFLFYDKMPVQVPVHYDVNGHVNRYVQKSYSLILFAPLMQILMSVLFTFMYCMIKNRRRRIDPSNEEESRWKQSVFRKSMGRFSVVEGLLTVVLFACLQLSFLNVLNAVFCGVAIGVILAVILFYTAWITIKIGQGGSRVKSKKISTDKLNVKDSDSYWKLGVFYCNPNDPTVFVEKRFGIGYTLNFGRPAAYLVIIGIVVFVVLSLVLSMCFVK